MLYAKKVNRADALIQRGKLKKLNNNKKAPMGAFLYVYFKMYIKNLIVILKNNYEYILEICELLGN